MLSHDDDWPENWVPFIRPVDGPRGYDNVLHHGPDHQEWEHWLKESARELLALEAASSDGLDSWSVLNAVSANSSIKDVCVKIAGLSAPKCEILSQALAQLSHATRFALFDSSPMQPHPQHPHAESLVDKLLNGVARSSASLQEVRIFASGGPTEFAAFAKRFCSTLERLFLGDMEAGIVLTNNFIRAIGVAMANGDLETVRSLTLHGHGTAPAVTMLLTALAMSAQLKVEEYRFYMCSQNMDILNDVANLCLISKTIKILNVSRLQNSEVMTDAGALLCANGAPELGFAPTLTSVNLRGLYLSPWTLEEPTCWTSRASQSMKHVRSLRLHDCQIPNVHILVWDMHSLQCLAILNPTDLDNRPTVMSAEGPFFNFQFPLFPKMLRSNQELESLATALLNRRAPVQQLEIDLVVTAAEDPVELLEEEALLEDQVDFPAVTTLMRGCQGSLSLNFGSPRWANIDHLRRGLGGISPAIKHLGLRFCDPQFLDQDFDFMLQTLMDNQTLTSFELELMMPSVVDEEGILDIGPPLPLCATRIGTVLESNCRLQRLAVYGDQHARFQTLVLRHTIDALSTSNRTLTRLDVCYMDIDDELLSLLPTIHEMLQHNDVFHTLNGFPFPEWDHPLYSQVKHLFKLNRYGRRFLVRCDEATLHLSSAIWSVVLSKIRRGGDPAVMYHFLRSKPDLAEGEQRGTKREHDVLNP